MDVDAGVPKSRLDHTHTLSGGSVVRNSTSFDELGVRFNRIIKLPDTYVIDDRNYCLAERRVQRLSLRLNWICRHHRNQLFSCPLIARDISTNLAVHPSDMRFQIMSTTLLHILGDNAYTV